MIDKKYLYLYKYFPLIIISRKIEKQSNVDAVVHLTAQQTLGSPSKQKNMAELLLER